MARPVLTYQLVWAAATDAGNRSMRKAGRKAWNRADYNASVREFHRLAPHIADPEERFRVTGNPYSARAKFTHRRVRAPGRFVRGSFRTKRLRGGKELVLGRLKGPRRRTATGRRALAVQSVRTPKRGRIRKNPSERAAWDNVHGIAAMLARHRDARVRSLAYDLRVLADEMERQLQAGVHENPAALAVVGANPGVGWGRGVTAQVTEIRYRRRGGAHPGFYRHVFKTPAFLHLHRDGALSVRERR